MFLPHSKPGKLLSPTHSLSLAIIWWGPGPQLPVFRLVPQSCCQQRQVFWNENRTASSQVFGYWLGLLPGSPHRLGYGLLLKLGLIWLHGQNPQSMARLSCRLALKSHLPATCLVGFWFRPAFPSTLPICGLFRSCLQLAPLEASPVVSHVSPPKDHQLPEAAAV